MSTFHYDVMTPVDRSAPFLRGVEERLRAAVATRDDGTPELLSAASRALVMAGGKRVRPRLAMLAGFQLGVPDADVQRVAAAAELMHAASLLHDDVIDEGQLRRGQPTANARWGNAAAVLAGDWLLTQALQQLFGMRASLTTTAIATAAEMTGAAILEIEARAHTDHTLEAWRRVAEGKTGVLFAWCGRAVALLAGRDEAGRALDDFGRHLGVAFQMADDLRDVCDRALGKDRFSDIRSKTPSSVLVLAMTRAPALRARVERAWRAPVPPEEEVEQIGAAIVADGVTAAAVALIEDELRQAQAAARRVAPRSGVDWMPDLMRLGERFLEGLR